ncbi:Alstrom Syndrome Protein 1 [Manis pentadactyla]|nr:Alstrom Syndrome Protein 1 [Manis pentadactyla]
MHWVLIARSPAAVQSQYSQFTGHCAPRARRPPPPPESFPQRAEVPGLGFPLCRMGSQFASGSPQRAEEQLESSSETAVRPRRRRLGCAPRAVPKFGFAAAESVPFLTCIRPACRSTGICSASQYRQLELNLIPLQFKVVSSPFASGRVWVRALPPPLGLPRLKDTEWQVGSSRSLAGSRKPASLPKVAVAAGSPLARSRLKLGSDAADAAAAAAAAEAEPPKLHTSREGGRSAVGRDTGGSSSQPPRSGKLSFSSGGHFNRT